MKKGLVFMLLLSLGFTWAANAQEVYNSSGKTGYHKKGKKSKGYDPDKLIVGGGINAGFGGGYINVGAAPIVGYRITNHFSAGVGLGYQYNRTPIGYDPTNVDKLLYQKDNIVYPSIWMREFIFRNIFVDAVGEYDLIFSKRSIPYGSDIIIQKASYGVPCALVGIGLRQPLGGRVSFYGEIMYDVLQQENSPYFGQPIFRLGIAAGF